MSEPWRRERAGVYVREDEAGYYLIERGWGDAGDVDRRRQTWVLFYVAQDGAADILSEHRRLRDAVDDANERAGKAS